MTSKSLLPLTLYIVGGIILTSCQKSQPKSQTTPSKNTDKEKVQSSKSEVNFKPIAEQFFENFDIVLKTQSPQEVSKLLNTTAIYKSVRDTRFFEGKNKKYLNHFKEGIALNFAKNLISNASLVTSDSPTVIRCESINPNTLIVYTSSWNRDYEVSIKMRWWLTKEHNGSWKISDYEDLDMGLRMSTLANTIAGAFASNPPIWLDDLNSLISVLKGLDISGLLTQSQSELAATSRLIEHELPNDIFVFAHVMHANSLLNVDQFTKALKHLTIAESKKTNTPMIHYLKGVCFSALKQWDDAISNFNLYGEILEFDANLYEHLAACYAAKLDSTKALELARKGIELNPNSLGCLSSLCTNLPANQHSEVITHINKHHRSYEAYDTAIRTFIYNKHFASAQSYIPLMEKDFPNSELLPNLKKELKEALEVQEALESQSEEK